MKAIVVFHDHGNHWFTRFLKPGFRHVLCDVQDERGYWVRVDAKAGVPEIGMAADKDFDLAAWWRGRDGYTVIETETKDLPPRAPWMVANCVGMVKAVLSIRSLAVTPYQLYRKLRSEKT